MRLLWVLLLWAIVVHPALVRLHMMGVVHAHAVQRARTTRPG